MDGKRHQVADPLTKKNGNADLLRAILKKEQFVIVEEAEALKIKEEERERRLGVRGLLKEGLGSTEASEKSGASLDSGVLWGAGDRKLQYRPAPLPTELPNASGHIASVGHHTLG